MLGMEIYVEYALIENFALDFALGYLACVFSKTPVKIKGLFVGAFLGAVFAIFYPLLKLYAFYLAEILKITFPFLICFCLFGGRISKKDRGRYALNVLSFFLSSFIFAGGAYAVCSAFSIPYAYDGGTFVGAPLGLTFSAFIFLTALSVNFAKRVYRRKRTTNFIYPCELKRNGKTVRADGFIDSGNMAYKDGKPVCFVSADLFFEIVGVEWQSIATEELALSTVAGDKKIKIFFLDEIKIYCDGKANIISKPYCAVKTFTGAREYKVLLGAWALDG